MPLEGFIPYDSKAAERYEKKRWWLGITLGDMLDKAADLYPRKEALIGSGKRYTYSELRRQADTMACRLLQAGFEPGDRVLLQLPNWPEFVISYFALQKAGLIMVLLTVNHTAREISHLADLTRPSGWILPVSFRQTEFLPLTRQIQGKNPALDKIVLAGPQKPNGYLRLDDLIQPGLMDPDIQAVLEDARPHPNDVCQILPSGGTTGLPKGAPRTHNDYLCNVEYKSRAWHINVGDTCLVATTVGHNLALLVCITGPLFHGATVVMLDSTYPRDFCQIVQDEKITCAGLVPTLISRIVNYENLTGYDLSSLRKIYVGAANSPPDLVQNVEEKIGARYINAFGMVEGPCAQTRPDDPIEIRSRSIGQPVCPYDEIITVDFQGNPTPPSQEGELIARGPGIFTGYFRNAQANEDAFTADGYFRTGDLAVIDKNGILRITGRVKDIIIRGGENIGAQEVEELISSHPSVEYVAVVAMPDPDLGEQICAYIKAVKGAGLAHENIIAHLEQIGASKKFFPARIEFVEEIPLTAAGKADKKILKKDIGQRSDK
ncbi:MAG: AMP-binding protein [Desulfobacterales bacterium]|jgi:2,3-dihydroxybenzoate-AMP ligase/mycobactin salicyl-AMP ligase|nr:AMP-binding protein [Desulfobacterales bacterium]